jgi:hypothetical protein
MFKKKSKKKEEGFHITQERIYVIKKAGTILETN